MEFLNRIHENYNPGVTEMYVLVPLAIIVAVVLYFMVKKENRELCAYHGADSNSNDPNDICKKCWDKMHEPEPDCGNCGDDFCTQCNPF